MNTTDTKRIRNVRAADFKQSDTAVVLIIDVAPDNIVLARPDNAVSDRDTRFRPCSMRLGLQKFERR